MVGVIDSKSRDPGSSYILAWMLNASDYIRYQSIKKENLIKFKSLWFSSLCSLTRLKNKGFRFTAPIISLSVELSFAAK